MLKLTKYEGNLRVISSPTLSVASDVALINTTTSVTSLLEAIGSAFTVDNGGNRINPKTFEITMIFLSAIEAETAITVMSNDIKRGRLGRLWLHSDVTNSDYYINCVASQIATPQYYKNNTIKVGVSFYSEFPYWVKPTEYKIKKYSESDSATIQATHWFSIDCLSPWTNGNRFNYMLRRWNGNHLNVNIEHSHSSFDYFWVNTAEKTLSSGFAGYDMSSTIYNNNPFAVLEPYDGTHADTLELYYGTSTGEKATFTINEYYEVPV